MYRIHTERLTFLSPRFGALTDVTKEYGLEDDSLMVAMCKIKEIMSETWRIFKAFLTKQPKFIPFHWVIHIYHEVKP